MHKRRNCFGKEAWPSSLSMRTALRSQSTTPAAWKEHDASVKLYAIHPRSTSSTPTSAAPALIFMRAMNGILADARQVTGILPPRSRLTRQGSVKDINRVGGGGEVLAGGQGYLE